ncbi:MAG TPA: hypothetical protein VIR57_10985 [Chloroflexota bacterium]|jgi:hypothetical protein
MAATIPADAHLVVGLPGGQRIIAGMADKAAQVTGEAKKAFAHYREQQNPATKEEATFVAGFMAGYIMGFAEGLEDDPFGRVVGRMLRTHNEAIAVPYEARTYTLTVRPS